MNPSLNAVRSNTKKVKSTVNVKENNVDVTTTPKKFNRKMKVLSTEEKTLLNCLNNCYENIDKNVPLSELTESEKAIITLKEVFNNENLKIRPVAPKPKHELEISKPLMKSVIQNSKLKNVIENYNLTTIKRPKRAQSISIDDVSNKSLKFENKESRITKNKMSTRRHSSGDVLLKTKSKNRWSLQLLEPGGKSNKSDFISPTNSKKQDQRKSKAVATTLYVAKKPEHKVKVSRRKLKILSVEEEALINCLNDCYSHIDENMPHSQLTESEKAIVALKEIFNNGEYKMKPVAAKSKDQLVISKPLLNSVLENSKLKDAILDPNVISTDVINGGREEFASSKNYGNISSDHSNVSSEMVKIPIRSRSDNDLFRKKNSKMSPSLKASKHESSISLTTTNTIPKAYDDIQFTFDVMINNSDRSDSSETISNAEFNLDTGVIQPYMFESSKTYFMPSVGDTIQHFDDVIQKEINTDNIQSVQSILIKTDTLHSKELSEQHEVKGTYENITNKLNLIKELISEDHSDLPTYVSSVVVSNYSFNADLNKDEVYKPNLPKDVVYPERKDKDNLCFLEDEEINIDKINVTKENLPICKKAKFDSKLKKEQNAEDNLNLFNKEKINSAIDQIPNIDELGKNHEIAPSRVEHFTETVDGKSSIVLKDDENNKLIFKHEIDRSAELKETSDSTIISVPTNIHISLEDIHHQISPNIKTETEDITKKFYTNVANNSSYKSRKLELNTSNEDDWTFGPLDSDDDEEYNYKNILRENRFGVTSPFNIRSSYREVVREIKRKFRPLSLQHSINEVDFNFAEIAKSKYDAVVTDIDNLSDSEVLENKQRSSLIFLNSQTHNTDISEVDKLPTEDNFENTSITSDENAIATTENNLEKTPVSKIGNIPQKDVQFNKHRVPLIKAPLDDLFYIDTLTKLQKIKSINEEKENDIHEVKSELDGHTYLTTEISIPQHDTSEYIVQFCDQKQPESTIVGEQNTELLLSNPQNSNNNSASNENEFSESIKHFDDQRRNIISFEIKTTNVETDSNKEKFVNPSSLLITHKDLMWTTSLNNQDDNNFRKLNIKQYNKSDSDEPDQNVDLVSTTENQNYSMLNILENDSSQIHKEEGVESNNKNQKVEIFDSDLYSKVASTPILEECLQNASVSNETYSVLNLSENDSLQIEKDGDVTENQTLQKDSDLYQITILDLDKSYLNVKIVPVVHENYSVLQFTEDYCFQNECDEMVAKEIYKDDKQDHCFQNECDEMVAKEIDKDDVDKQDYSFQNECVEIVAKEIDKDDVDKQNSFEVTIPEKYDQTLELGTSENVNGLIKDFPNNYILPDQNENDTDNINLDEHNSENHETSYFKVKSEEIYQKIGLITYENESYSVLHFPENSTLQKQQDVILINDTPMNDPKVQNAQSYEPDIYFKNKFSKIPKRINQSQQYTILNKDNKYTRTELKSSKDKTTVVVPKEISDKSFVDISLRTREYSPVAIKSEHITHRQSYPTIDKRLLTDMKKVKQFARHFERLSTDKIQEPKSPTQKMSSISQQSKKKPVPNPRIKHQLGEKNDISDDDSLADLPFDSRQDDSALLQFQESNSKLSVNENFNPQESLNVLDKTVDEKPHIKEEESTNFKNMFTVKSVLEIKSDESNSIHKAQTYSSVPMLGKPESLNTLTTPIHNNLKESSSLKLPSLEPMGFKSFYSDIPRQVENNAYEHLQERKSMFINNEKKEDEERPKIEFVPLDDSTQPFFNKHPMSLDNQFMACPSFGIEEKDMKPKFG